MEEYSIGIDVGGTKTAYGLFDSDKNLIDKYRTPSDADMNATEFFDTIILNIRNLLVTYNISLSQLQGVG